MVERRRGPFEPFGPPSPGEAPPSAPSSASGYIVEFRCGAAIDCVPVDGFAPTFAAAQPPAAAWIAQGSGRTANIRPLGPGEPIPY